MRRRNVAVAAMLGTRRRRDDGRGRARARRRAAAVPVRDVGPVPRLSQRHDHAIRGRRLDRVRLAWVDDGQQRPRSVLASRGPARDRRLPGRRVSHPERVRRVPHADGALPGARRRTRAGGLLPPRRRTAAAAAVDPLALDGVSCALCHQLQNGGPGLERDGEFKIDTARPWGERLVFGPYDIPPPRARVMHSATGFLPARATNLEQSEICSTCHTLYTTPLGGARATNRRHASPSRCRTWNGGPAPMSARRAARPAT